MASKGADQQDFQDDARKRLAKTTNPDKTTVTDSYSGLCNLISVCRCRNLLSESAHRSLY
jgi:hypothetical protein